jgi:ABC-type Na+ efflux pump permease subunit
MRSALHSHGTTNVRVLTIVLAIYLVFMAVSVMAKSPDPEQAVIVHFDYGNPNWSPFFAFDKQLDAVISKAGVGEYDGNELAQDGSDGYLYFYGPDADKLFAVVKTELTSAPFLKNVRVTLRYGSVDDPKAREVHLRLRP